MTLSAVAWQAATFNERKALLSPGFSDDSEIATAQLPEGAITVSWFWLPLFNELERILARPLPEVKTGRLNYRNLVESIEELCRREGLIEPELVATKALQDAWLECLAPTLNSAYSNHLNTETQLNEEELTQQFMRSLWSGTFATLLKEYPVLLRLLATRLHFWKESLTEILARLKIDQSEIHRVFFSEQEIGLLKTLSMSLSDAHGGGRGVAILEFSSGQQLIYKPKSLAMDAALPAISAQLEALGHPFKLVAVPVMDRGDYGWSAFIDDEQTKKANPDSRLAKKLGQMCALAHAVGCTDLHLENFAIVNGHPVLWDLETFLRPHFALGQRSARQHPSRRAILAQYEDSVIGVGLVDDSLPKEQSQFQLDTAGWDAFIEGFQEVYQWQITHLSAFVAVWNSLSDDLPIRSVILATAHYAEVLQASYQPSALRDGLSWSRCLSGIRSDTDSQSALEQWVHDAEVMALARLDVPAFYLRKSILSEAGGSSRDLEAAGDEYLTPIVHAREKWTQLGDRDLALQMRLLRVQRDDSKPSTNSPSTHWADRTPLLETSRLTDMGLRFADQILDAANRSDEGAQWWSRTISKRGKVRLAPMLASLYDGTIGIALLLGAAHKVTGNSRYQIGAQAALRPLLHDFKDDWRRPRIQQFLGIGGVSGYSSMLHVCRHLMTWGVADEANELFEKLHSLISHEEISQDTNFDVISGAAGLILNLIPSDGVPVNANSLDQANWAGEHLLRKFPAPSKDWQPEQNSPLGGFSHGAAGFALAHHRLARVTGEARYESECERWITYQESLRHPQTGHYRDLRVESDQQADWDGLAMCSWCHGAPGIGLAWSEIGKTIEAQRALQTMNAHPYDEARDFLCCGNMGRIACGFTTATRLGETTIAQTLRTRANNILPCKAPWELLWQHGQNCDNVSFYQGLSGIAYTLLRLDHPNELPCILGHS